MNKTTVIAIFIGTLFVISANAQPLSLYTCLDSAAAQMPLLKQQDMMSEVLSNKLKSYNRTYLPMVTLNGQASYQSDVPELPFSIPGSPGLEIPKTQYRAYVEVYQPLFDAGMAQAAKKAETAHTEASLYALQVSEVEYKKQVAQLFFQMLLVDDQLEIVSASLDLMRSRQRTLEKAVENGVAQQNDVLKLQSQILAQENKQEDLLSARENGMELLELLTGIPAQGRELVVPELQGSLDYNVSGNPQLQMIRTQQGSLLATEGMLKAQRMPRVNAFAQAGMGSPNPYNFFQKDLSSFYIVGVRANWTIWDWGKTSLDRKNLRLNHQMLDEQRNQKQIEVEGNISRLRSNGEKLRKALERDAQLLSLRTQIRKNAEIQVEQGVITSNDYLDEVLAEQMAALTKSVDEISLYQNTILLQFETGGIK